MTTAATSRLPGILDPDLPFGMVGFLAPDGHRLCAACGCREDVHCDVCGCRTNKGSDDECLCAKFLAAIATCPHCGNRFRHRWQLQVHLLPTPRCQSSARAAAGRYAAPPSFDPPLRPDARR